MDLIQILFTLVHFTVVSMACNLTAVKRCFESLSEELNIDIDQTEGSALIDIINPSTLNDDQVKKCLSLKGYEFAPLRSCIRTAQCANQSIIRSIESPLPSITWLSVVDLMKGVCEPGCENLQSKNREAEKCSMKTGTCSDLSESFRCYRDTIGECEVLVTFVRSVLDSMGVFDRVRLNCPDVDAQLESFSAATILSYSRADKVVAIGDMTRALQQSDANPAFFCVLVLNLLQEFMWK